MKNDRKARSAASHEVPDGTGAHTVDLARATPPAPVADAERPPPDERTTTDERTSHARALDRFAEWIAPRVPDRVPGGVALPYSGPLSDFATEYGRRLFNKFGRPGAPTRSIFHDSRLGKLMDELPRLLRDPTLTDERLQDLLRQIEPAVARLENPEAPPALPAWWWSLAVGLGCVIDDDLERASRVLLAALRDAWTGDRRAAPLLEVLRRAVELRADMATPVLQARHALVGFGLAPVDADDPAFGMNAVGVTLDVLCPPPPAYPPQRHLSAPGWLEDLGRELGVLVPSHGDHGARAAQIETWLADETRSIYRRRDAGLLKAGDATDEAIAQLKAEATAQRQGLNRDYSERVEAMRVAIVAGIDAELERLAAAEGCTLRYWWTRELRRHVADHQADRALTPGVHNDRHPAWRAVKSLGVVITVRSAGTDTSDQPAAKGGS